jgi:hypothetical protein
VSREATRLDGTWNGKKPADIVESDNVLERRASSISEPFCRHDYVLSGFQPRARARDAKLSAGKCIEDEEQD